MLFRQELWWLPSPLFSVSVVPGSAPSDVCSQKSAVKDFDERGGMKGAGGGRRKSLILPSWEFTHSQPTATHAPLSIRPSFLSLSSPFIYCLSSSLSDPHLSLSLSFARSVSLTHRHTLTCACARLSSQPHTPATIRQDSASASISRVVSIWHRAFRPLRHSPVPPHSALLVTRDNWARNFKFQKGLRVAQGI